MNTSSILEACRDRLRVLAEECGLSDEAVTIRARTLSPEEAIGTPGRRDYPILEGVERVVEAKVRNARGQAFTDAPSDFEGRFREVIELPLTTSHERALFLAATNAALCHMELIETTVHCKDDAPESCGSEIAAAARSDGARSVGLIGFNPAIAEALVHEFGNEHIRITDLNPQNIGRDRFGVTIWDGATRTRELIESCDLILLTGSTLANNTFDGILQQVRAAQKRLIVFGVTGAGVCRLMNLERWCPKAQRGALT